MRVAFAILLVALVAAGAWWKLARVPAPRPDPVGAPIANVAAGGNAQPGASGLAALPPEVATALSASDAVIVSWSSHSGARLEPCGCVAGMHGGLVRRASLQARAPAERTLRLEGGGWSGGAADYQLVRGDYFLRGLAVIGTDAVGIGAAETRLGQQRLRRLLDSAERAKIQVVSANVTSADGAPVGAKLARVRRGGRDFAITAVAPASSSDGLIASDPAEALSALLPELAGASLVVIADLDADGCRALAKAVPGVSLIVGGDVHDPSLDAIAVGPARVVYAANDGKTLGWWPWGGARCAFELVDDRIPDRAEVRALIRSYQEAVGAMDLEIDDRLVGMTSISGGPAANAHYVGSQTCRFCHAQASTIHVASGHARAFATLEAKSYQRDPDCLRCHVVGLSLSDGYRRKAPTAALAQVGCESCHGRGSVHVAERGAGRPASGSLQPVTPATCTRCHDPENSPSFDYATYWPRIRHDAR